MKTDDQAPEYTRPAGGREPGEHPSRREVLDEIHARPFIAMETPRRLIHFAYLTDEAAAAADRAALSAFASRHGGHALEDGARHITLTLPQGRLRWERHTEFTTYSWDVPVTDRAPGWAHSPAFVPSDAPPPPGPLVVALELLLIAGDSGDWHEKDTIRWGFDQASLCVSGVDGDAAIALTDFRPDDDGFTRILVVDTGLDPQRAGGLVRRLVEIETYRTLALMSLPMVRHVTPDLDRIETDLVTMLHLSDDSSGPDHKSVLNRLTDMATALETQKSETSYRLSASEAYHAIVLERVQALREQPLEGHHGWDVFLNRRLGPALRTSQSLRERQDSLSVRLSRATELLRTRVDIALEAQNNAVLRAMNRRSQLQLRLQQTVEGLSVAAVTYYVVGLVSYVAEGVEQAGLPVPPQIVAAVAVPIVALGVWSVIRGIRRRFESRGGHGG